jgi:gliding motility-associated-like protein
MRNKLSKSTTRMKAVFFLFLGLLFSVTVKSQNCQIIDSAIVTDVRCHLGTDGSIDLVLLNPLGLYAYAWNTTEIIQDITNLPPGTYSVTVTDLTDTTCTQDTSYTVTQPQDPLSTVVNLVSDVKCYGDSSGSATAENAIGGTFPYTYAWDNGQTSPIAVNLWAATHTVTVTDANGCTFQSSIDIVNSNPAITGVANILNHVSCFGACDADIEFSSAGGILPHTYNWSPVSISNYNGSGPDTAFNVCVGGHNVLIEDLAGCEKTIQFTITEPDELFANAIGNGAPIPGQLPTQPVQCFGFNDGTAYASATQGTLGYTFVWDSINGPTGQYIDNLTPGVHTVYVTDTNGCTASDTVLITEPTKLVVEIDSSATIYAYCSNTFSGELCAIASGGTPNYQYAWNSSPIQNTSCAYNLIARSALYEITVMDDRNCIATASFDLDSITNSMNEDSVVIIENSVSCFGLYDGALTVSSVLGGLGGVPNYSYSWNGPNGYTGTSSSITSLYFGSYALVIEDDNGCKTPIGTYLNQPDQLEYDIYNTVDETCLGAENGQIWVHINGGTGSYYYDFSESGNFPILAADTVQVINDSLIFNFATGTHSIYITDDNNCEGAVTFGAGTGGWQRDINTLLTIPAPIFASNATTCYNTNNGTAQVLDPDPLYTYTWENDIFGSPSGTDISNGAGTYFGAFSPGDYWLVAHYADSASFGIPYYGCDNSVPFTILPGSPQIIDGETITNVSCYSDNDGQIDLIISGGVGPYDLYWDTTSVTPSGLIVNGVVSNYLFDNLLVGTYAVTIIDSDGCITIEDYEVTEPSPLISDIIPTHVSCFDFNDGSAEVQVVLGTGTPVYTYVWNTVPITTPIITLPPYTVADALVAGTYTVTVTDDQGCTYTDMIDILQPTAPVASVEVDSLYYGPFDVRCFGESNAAAIATGSGVSFVWTDVLGNTVSTDQHTATILSADLTLNPYTVTATDANGCEGSDSIIITDPDVLFISVLESNPSSTYQISCFDADDGWAEVTIQGGVVNNNVFGYDISWVNSAGNTIIGDTIADNLSAGFSYTVTVTDANGCTDFATTILYTEPIEFIADVTTINYAGPFHAPKNISFIDSTISVESYGFEWIWQNGLPEYRNGVNQIDNQVFIHEFLKDELGANYVFVMLTNEVTGCQDSVEFIIEVQGMPEVNNVFTPNQDGINDEFLFSEYAMGIVDVQIFNRWGQLVYTWVGSDKSWKGIGIDGKDLPEGVYFYVFEGKGFDGYHYDKKGSVTLLR